MDNHLGNTVWRISRSIKNKKGELNLVQTIVNWENMFCMESSAILKLKVELIWACKSWRDNYIDRMNVEFSGNTSFSQIIVGFYLDKSVLN